MKTEYKRDMNHNYLIFYGEEEIDTSSYQVRMLVGNVVPSLLNCRIQGMDGTFMVYYDITSRQSVADFYENKKLGIEDLKLLFGGFVKVMEDMAEYLLNPGQLVLSPDYIFMDVEKRKLYFCLVPGLQKEVKEQFQALTEYILPGIDHKDNQAVMLGYGVYRRALEDSFHLEHMKEELYKAREDAQGEYEPEKAEEKAEASSKAADFQTDRAGVQKEICRWQDEDVFSRGDENPTDMKCGFWLKIKNRLFGKGKKKKKTEKEKIKKEKAKKEKVRESAAIAPEIKKDLKPAEIEESQDYGETIVLSAMSNAGPASFVSREPGELATIYLKEELTVVGKMEHAADAVIDVATVSRIHAKIRKRDDKYYLTDLNSRNGTSVNGRLLRPGEEYELQPEDEVDFAQARYIFLE